MSGSKDKYLDALLAINRTAFQAVLSEEVVKVLSRNPGAGDVLSGLVTRSLIGALFPHTLRNLKKIGIWKGT